METERLHGLYFQFSQKILSFLRSLSNSDDMAFDLMQETFLLADKYFNFEKIQNPEAWLITTAKNLFYKEMKKNKKIELVPNNKFERTDEARESDELGFSLLKQDIITKLAQAKPLYAEIFILRFDLHMTYHEISQVIDKPLITVRRYLEKIKTIIELNFSEELRSR